MSLSVAQDEVSCCFSAVTAGVLLPQAGDVQQAALYLTQLAIVPAPPQRHVQCTAPQRSRAGGSLSHRCTSSAGVSARRPTQKGKEIRCLLPTRGAYVAAASASQKKRLHKLKILESANIRASGPLTMGSSAQTFCELCNDMPAVA